jgi:FkbM family methyltransferase
MTILDIGAHVGYYARLFSQLVGQDGQVIAFEPHPRTHQVLQKNLSNHSNVEALQVAVSNEAGTAELYDYLMMSASGSLHYDESMIELQKAQLSTYDVAPRIAKDFPVETFSVETVQIDTCLQEKGIEQVDLIKMDIEGAEMNALRGMTNIIQNSPHLALIMEYNPHALSASIDPIDALSEVMVMGFSRMQAIQDDGSLLDLTRQPMILKTMTDQMMKHIGVINILFTR